MSEDELEQLKADAARYQYIRDNYVWHRGETAIVGPSFPYKLDFSCKPMLDFHIDQAIKNEQ